MIESAPSSNISTNPRPWVRYLARMIDIYLFGLVFQKVLETITNFWVKNELALSSYTKIYIIIYILVQSFIYIFVESIILSTLGNTFGKWLLKIQISNNQSKKIPFFIAIKRSFLVWIYGFGAGLPLISLCTHIVAYSHLTTRKITTWDQKCNLMVSHQKIGIVRIILIILFFILSFIGSLFITLINNNLLIKN